MMSNKNCKSITTGEPCTEAQYIAEFLCIREAKLKGVDLPIRFWKLPQWKKRFIKSIVWANRALSRFSFESIMKLLKQKQFSKRYDLANKQLLNEIEKTQSKLDNITFQETEEREINGTQKPFSKRSIRDGLL